MKTATTIDIESGDAVAAAAIAQAAAAPLPVFVKPLESVFDANNITPTATAAAATATAAPVFGLFCIATGDEAPGQWRSPDPFELARVGPDETAPHRFLVCGIAFPPETGIGAIFRIGWKEVARAAHAWDTWRRERDRKRQEIALFLDQRDDFSRLLAVVGVDLTGQPVRRVEPTKDYPYQSLSAVVDGVPFEYTDPFQEIDGLVCVAYADGTRSPGLRSLADLGATLEMLERIVVAPPTTAPESGEAKATGVATP